VSSSSSCLHFFLTHSKDGLHGGPAYRDFRSLVRGPFLIDDTANIPPPWIQGEIFPTPYSVFGDSLGLRVSFGSFPSFSSFPRERFSSRPLVAPDAETSSLFRRFPFHDARFTG